MNMNKFYFLLAKQRKLQFDISSLIKLRAEIKNEDIVLTFEKTAKDFENGLLHDKKRSTTLENPSFEELKNILSIPVVEKQINDAYGTELAIFEEKARALHEAKTIIDNLPNASVVKKKILNDIFSIAAKNNQFRLSPHISLCIVDVCNKMPTKPSDLHFKLRQHIPSKTQNTRILGCEDIELVQQIGKIFDKNQNAIFGAVIDEKSKIERQSYADVVVYEHLKRQYQAGLEK
ncbi:MAG: hypothetical protein IJ959_00490 [Clostridia bacterium]|nr:hypothetical protein [Clostridia bacterium]